jgi:hypothetical protein
VKIDELSTEPLVVMHLGWKKKNQLYYSIHKRSSRKTHLIAGFFDFRKLSAFCDASATLTACSGSWWVDILLLLVLLLDDENMVSVGASGFLMRDDGFAGGAL